MKELEVYILLEKHTLTREIERIVGVFSDYTVCAAAKKALLDNEVNLTAIFEIIGVKLDKLLTYRSHIPAFAVVKSNQYIIDAIKERLTNNDIEQAVKSVTLESINKILNEISDCIDNPEIVKEYIQGLRDNVEDFI